MNDKYLSNCTQLKLCKRKKKKEERSTLVDTTCTNSCLYDAKLTQYVLYFKLTQIKIRAVVVNSFETVKLCDSLSFCNRAAPKKQHLNDYLTNTIENIGSEELKCI